MYRHMLLRILMSYCQVYLRSVTFYHIADYFGRIYVGYNVRGNWVKVDLFDMKYLLVLRCRINLCVSGPRSEDWGPMMWRIRISCYHTLLCTEVGSPRYSKGKGTRYVSVSFCFVAAFYSSLRYPTLHRAASHFIHHKFPRCHWIWRRTSDLITRKLNISCVSVVFVLPVQWRPNISLQSTSLSLSLSTEGLTDWLTD